MKQVRVRHQTVESIPEKLQANILYVTTEGDVAGHLCACGCGREVITPLSPTDWSLTFDRRGPTLSPSIGNWAFPCRSHYFVRDGSVVWAYAMSDEVIARGRRWDKARKQRYYGRLNEPLANSRTPTPALSSPLPSTRQSSWQRLLVRWKRMLAR